jgi:hypothetical protein
MKGNRMSDALQRIAALASSLSQAELRVLLELAVRAEAAGATEIMASSRHLAQSTGLARASVQGAIDSLNARRFIQSDTGSPTKPALHRLICFHREANTSGLVAEPPVAQLLSHPGITNEPRVALQLSHGGLATGPGVAQPVSHGGLIIEPEVAQPASHPGLVSAPPRNEKSVAYGERIKERASAPADSIDFDFDKTIDRLHKAKKGDFEESLFETARMQIVSHHAKYAREENRLSGPPDDAITAQFLAVAEWPRLEALLCDLAAERKEAGYSYGWYVTVALQRIHGLSPARVREMRAQLKASAKVTSNVAVVPRPTPFRGSEAAFHRKPSGREQSPGFEQRADTEQLRQQIRAVAAARSMR